MKPGREYEAFLYETFSAFYPDFDVRQNDKILGRESGINREIDVSIRGEIDGTQLLYLVQAKDHKKPADIKIIGEFSAVVRDVGASKGFLICSAGFAKTIRRYARTLGIELLTVEDINSRRWKASIEIPVVVRTYELPYTFCASVIVSEALAEANKVELSINLNECDWSIDSGRNFKSTDDIITDLLLLTGHDLDELSEDSALHLRLAPETTMVTVAQCPCHINEGYIEVGMTRTAHLKMVVPSDYRHIRDHLKPAILPTKLGLSTDLKVHDGSWTLVDFKKLPVSPNSILVGFDLLPTPLRAAKQPPSSQASPPGNRSARRAAGSKQRGRRA